MLIIIHSKYFDDTYYKMDENEPTPKNYSESIIVLIVYTAIYVGFLIVSAYTLVKDQSLTGMFVWNRDSFGQLFQQIVFFSLSLITMILFQKYIKIKEDRNWKFDIEGDHVMDFYEAFLPTMILAGLYMIKCLFLKERFEKVKIAMALDIGFLAYCSETLFDRS